MKAKTIFFSVSIFLSSFCFLEAGWLERKAEGFWWYEEKEKPLPELSQVEIPMTLSATEQLAQEKKKLELLLATALLDPNQQNVAQYMVAQKRWTDQSAEFSKSWAKVLLTQPSLDPTLDFATTHYGRQVQKRVKHEQKIALINKIAQEYGLFLFYEGKQPHSQAFIPIVKAFANKYHWSLMSISQDGTLLADLPDSESSPLAHLMGIQHFPALVAIHPMNKKVIPLAFGLKSLDQIEQALLLQFKDLPKED